MAEIITIGEKLMKITLINATPMMADVISGSRFAPKPYNDDEPWIEWLNQAPVLQKLFVEETLDAEHRRHFQIELDSGDAPDERDLRFLNEIKTLRAAITNALIVFTDIEPIPDTPAYVAEKFRRTVPRPGMLIALNIDATCGAVLPVYYPLNQGPGVRD